jgi:hypothetical protein
MASIEARQGRRLLLLPGVVLHRHIRRLTGWNIPIRSKPFLDSSGFDMEQGGMKMLT